MSMCFMYKLLYNILYSIMWSLAIQGVQEQVGSGKAQAVSDLAVESPLEAAKTTMSNPVFQQYADDVNGMEEVP